MQFLLDEDTLLWKLCFQVNKSSGLRKYQSYHGMGKSYKCGWTSIIHGVSRLLHEVHKELPIDFICYYIIVDERKEIWMDRGMCNEFWGAEAFSYKFSSSKYYRSIQRVFLSIDDYKRVICGVLIQEA